MKNSKSNRLRLLLLAQAIRKELAPVMLAKRQAYDMLDDYQRFRKSRLC